MRRSQSNGVNWRCWFNVGRDRIPRRVCGPATTSQSAPLITYSAARPLALKCLETWFGPRVPHWRNLPTGIPRRRIHTLSLLWSNVHIILPYCYGFTSPLLYLSCIVDYRHMDSHRKLIFPRKLRLSEHQFCLVIFGTIFFIYRMWFSPTDSSNKSQYHLTLFFFL